MQQEVVKLLIEKNWHIAFAESCTGGMVCGALVDVADASKVLDVSFVTYANEAKMEYLEVEKSCIQQYGVVSEEVAYQMANGVAKRAGSQVGVGITGIAGPGGGTEQKPVGMVCFGFYVNGKTYTETMYFGNPGRNEVRAASTAYVYRQLLTYLTDVQ